MIDRDYLLEKPAPPSLWKQYLDLTMLPVMIDAAGAVEGVVERVAVKVKQRPLAGIGIALALGYGVGFLLVPYLRSVRPAADTADRRMAGANGLLSWVGGLSTRTKH